MTDFPDLKLKTVVSFPAAVNGGTGLAVRKQDGQFYFDLAFNELAPIVAIPTLTLPTTYLALWESTQNTYRTISVPSLQNQIGGGVSEAPNDGVQYGRKNLGWTAIVGGGGGGIPEAPTDGVLYGRGGSTPAWTKALAAANNLSDVASAPAVVRNLGGIDLSTPVAVTATTTLTSAAFSRYHVINGASSYTITLPSPTGVSGTLIAFRVENASTALALYTLASPSGNVGRSTSLVMWASESLLIRSDGVNWTIVDARQIPFSGNLSSTTDQTSSSTGVNAAYAVVSDPVGLNLFYDAANQRFKAPRSSVYTFSTFGYQTQTSGSYSQGIIITAGVVQLSGVFSWTATLQAGTIYGTTTAAVSAGVGVTTLFRCDGTSPKLASSQATARFDFVEAANQW